VGGAIAMVIIAVIKPILRAKEEAGDRKDASNDN